MPVQLNLFEKLILLKSNAGPGPMTDLLGGLSFKALLTSIKLGIFDVLDDSIFTAEEITRKLDCDIQGTVILLEALASLGYVKSKKNSYTNTSMTKKWLCKSSDINLSHLFFQFNDMLKRWDYLSETVRNGDPPMLGWQWLDKHPGAWDRYHNGLGTIARLVSDEIIKKAKIRARAVKLLDLGGSHGLYSILFCRHYPALSAVVLDWEQARQVAEKNIEAEQMSHRVRFRAGDFVHDSFEETSDIILMFNTIRIFNPEKLQELFKKFHKMLNPGGTLVIMDHLGDKSSSKFMKANTMLVLLELYNSTMGQTHDGESLKKWLTDSDYSSIKHSKLLKSPGLGIITATRA